MQGLARLFENLAARVLGLLDRLLRLFIEFLLVDRHAAFILVVLDVEDAAGDQHRIPE